MNAARLALALLFICAAPGCFKVPQASGPWLCGEDGTCPGGMLCDDGVCCHALEAPRCRTLVLEDGTCADGSTPSRWYLDADGDGYGAPSTERLACAQPVTLPEARPNARWVATGGDCDDDHPGVFTGAQELCDGLDNDCDGEVDEGLERRTFWPDADGDGAGDPEGQTLWACAPRPGFVANDVDCDDQDPTVSPGAPEQCNGRDDNCNGLEDDEVVGTGADCVDPSRVGACRAGRTACLAAEPVCRQHVLPSEETCNGVDDDCDGEVDGPPGCGGPSDLLSEDGVNFGARNLGDVGLGNVTGCLKTTSAGTPDLFTSGTWLITGATRHVAWMEKSTGTWDLSKAGLALKLAMSRNSYTGIVPIWSADHVQPLVLLCGPDGAFARYQPDATRLLTAGVPSEDLIPLAGGNGWTLTPSAPDLSRIRRVEVVFQAGTNSTGTTPNLRVMFDALGFAPAP